MPRSVAFQLGVNCLQNATFKGFFVYKSLKCSNESRTSVARRKHALSFISLPLFLQCVPVNLATA